MKKLAAAPATHAVTVCGVQQIDRQRGRLRALLWSLRPWAPVTYGVGAQGPLLFPSSTSRRQGGLDALGFTLRNSKQVSPAAAARPTHLLTRDHCSPLPCMGGSARRRRRHSKSLCGSFPVYYELFCVKTPGATMDH